MIATMDSLDFQWGGIDFRLQPRPQPGAPRDAPVFLHWRHPSGKAGFQRFDRLSDAMQHSSLLTARGSADPH